MTDGFVVWLTGLPGAGKSTIAEGVERHLHEIGHPVEVLDGDAVRANLSPGLGFTPEDRDTHTRRVTYVASLLARHGVGVVCALVSPERMHRERCRAHVKRFAEVHVTAPLDVLRERDPKGLYARQARGQIERLVGVTEPYEAPVVPEVTCRTDAESPEESAARVVRYLEDEGWITRRGRGVA